jgi:hypothetical protein
MAHRNELTEIDLKIDSLKLILSRIHGEKKNNYFTKIRETQFFWNDSGEKLFTHKSTKHIK